jgi:prepilin-type N-terminal cleavage/methylation domain-containing protein
MRKLILRVFGSRQRKKLIAAGKIFYIKGFTLIELLVAMLITAFLVSIMLSFLVGVLESDRKEQAKSEAQEEIQLALNYIADDLQEAIYIYDATALAAIDSQLPHQQTNDSCTKDNGCTPILVFWKRYVYEPTSKTSSKYHGCMPYDEVGTNYTKCVTDANTKSAAFGGDNFTFSLVAYYLKSDINDASITNPTWSKTARILRWELKDGYRWYCADGTACTPKLNADGTRTSNNTDITPQLVDKNSYFVEPDKGFNRPDFLSAGTLSQNAAKWRKFEDFNFGTNKFTTLVDFLDDTEYTNTDIKIAVQNDANCADPTIGVGVSSATMTAQRVPSDFSSATANPSKLTSFYACVAPEQVTARVYLRGNALSRIQPTQALRKPTDYNSPFFPTINVRAYGRSSLGLNKKSS